MSNLFGEEYEDQVENKCASKKEKLQGKKSTAAPSQTKMDEALPSRQIQVKMYNDFYLYDSPENVETPTLDHVRKWMVDQNGFTELMDPNRSGLMIVTPAGQEPYVFCGVKFEKMG